MRPPLRATRFLLAKLGVLPAPRPVVVPVRGGTVDVIEPVGAARGTVVSIHGMSPVAQRDPRIVAVHRGLAAAGLRVVAPHLASIAALRIHAGQIDEIEAWLTTIGDDPRLAPSGRVSVLAVSFSAGLSLVAAARPPIADRIDAVCAIGAFGDIRSTLTSLLEREDLTTYAWKIVLANFAETAIGERPGVRQALVVSALDEWYRRPVPELPRALATLPADERDLVRSLIDDPDARRALVTRVLAARPRMLDVASVVDHVGGLRGAVTLIHGRDDRTLPADQSRRLHEAMRMADVRVRLLVTPLLTHGDTALRVASLTEVGPLLGAFEGFFDEASAPRRTRVRAAA